jgi:uncharacterized repeat protein (TIGR03803 family)
MSIQVRSWILVMSLGFGLGVATTLPAQTYSVIHNFTGGNDGAAPTDVTIDGAGNLYGTASAGGGSGFGTVYELKARNGNYTLNPLYEFPGGAHGATPFARVVFGPDGLLYGTTAEGGNDNNGVVFKLQPRPSACASPLCSWMQTVLFALPGNGSGGSEPAVGGAVFDAAGDMYGTTKLGGTDDYGVVWELTPPGMWNSETVLASLTGPSGQYPGRNADGGVILDSSGNLYGTAFAGGTDRDGVVYQLVKSSGYKENVLYNFTGGNDGSGPNGGLVFDASGNLYGTASDAGSGGGGTVFELSPAGSWNNFSLLYGFTGSGTCGDNTGTGPLESLSIDSAGNLYGTTCADGANRYGNIFELTPSGSGWKYTDLYDFTGGTDGAYPESNAVCDSEGNLYGTTLAGGSEGHGVAWKISGVGCLPTNGPLFRP